MSILDSLLVDAFGLSIVFAVLISLSLIIKLITRIFGGLQPKKDNIYDEMPTKVEQTVLQPGGMELQYADGELKLIDVDEKMAALIMAIVSNESNIPLPQLQFKSIRLMK